jgi:hypothetical protein
MEKEPVNAPCSKLLLKVRVLVVKHPASYRHAIFNEKLSVI